MNRLQRWYFARARTYYDKLPPASRAQAEAIDRFIYSRRAVGAWLGFAGAMVGSTLGLHASGASWLAALLLSLLGVFATVACMIGGWLMPASFSPRKLGKFAFLMVIVTFAARMGTLFVHGELAGKSGAQWIDAALTTLWEATPFQLIGGLALLLMVWVSSTARRHSLQRELDQARAEQERDAAASQATQARLSLLQAQIQPHFLFNTLAALQHWVDVGDARAAPLLRSLTSFLRGSTELMLRDVVTLKQECEMVGHYLSIMRARLGDRLRWRIDMATDCEMQELPPGLLITLVENAVEHGIEPQLRGGEVQVIARQVDGTFELHVLDDGAGPVVLLGAPAVREGVGLTNSRERLRHRFGDRAVLQLGARLDGPGAQVCLRLLPETDRPHQAVRVGSIVHTAGP